MVVVDSCVLIHLSRTGRLDLLKHLKNVTITPEVYHEVVTEAAGRGGVAELEQACREWIKTVNPKSADVHMLTRLGGIEKADASIILLAEEHKDILLTNDRLLVQFTKTRGIDCWWPTTIILKMVKEGKLQPQEAEDILLELVKAGMRLRIEVYAAITAELRKTKV